MFRPIRFLERCREQLGPIFSIRLGGATTIVVIADPRDARKVLEGHPEVYHSGAANQLFRPVVGGNSLLLLDGAEHMAHRRILLPNFRGGHVRAFTEMIEATTRRRIAGWPRGEPFAMAPAMETITFETIMKIVFGPEDDPRDKRLGELIPRMMDRADTPFTLIPAMRRKMMGMSPFARLMKVVHEIDDLLFEMIDERSADPAVWAREDVLSALIQATHEDGTPLNAREIRDEVLTTIMAGYETTTSALTWSFERLVRSPEVLNRLLDEIELGEEEDYIDAVVKETLRQRPVVPLAARRLQAPVDVHGYTLPKGTVLLASIYLVHRDPEAFPEPDEFRPERFLEGGPAPAAWIPFGGGVRRCLGASLAQLEIKVVLQTVLAEVSLHAAEEKPEPIARRRFTFVPKHEGMVVAERIATRRFKPAPSRAKARTTSRVLSARSH
jgi:cytochrome P450 family 135